MILRKALKPCTPLARSYSSQPINPSTPSAQNQQIQERKVSISTLRRLYETGQPITMMTAHDYPSALFVQKAGIDICLVGDSLAMVALGYDSTTKLTMDEMLHHARAVSRASKSPFLIGDMPFGTYESCPEDAVRGAVRMMREGGNMDAVKLEGGVEMKNQIKAITQMGIPVLAHVGLCPQRTASLGGFRVQGKTLERAKEIVEDALAVQEAGAFAVVLEAIPEVVATHITKKLHIPTIGIGAGPGTSGQVLVQLDTLGVYDRFLPKFCKQYAQLGPVMTKALQQYRDEVQQGTFPESGKHTYPMLDGEEEKFLAWADKQ